MDRLEIDGRLTLLAVMFVHLLQVVPTHGGLVLPVALHPELPAEARLVV